MREALRRLAQEQLVEVFPRRGMFVTGVDVRDSRVSQRCARRSSPRRPASPPSARPTRSATSSPAARATDRAAATDLMALDERIHRAIYAAAHNHLLEKTLGEYYVLALRIWMIALDRAEDLEEAVEAHRDLIQAIVVGDGDRAAELMRAHVEDFEQAMRDVLVSV